MSDAAAVPVRWKPERPVEIVAGTPPGGGLDRSARALAAALAAGGRLGVPAQVVNIGGDGGRRAWAHIDAHPGDAHVVAISSPNMIADHLMGAVAADPDRYTPLAILYTEAIAFVVRPDRGIATGADLLRRLAHAPADVTIAFSTSRGNSNHVAIAKVVRHAGADPNAPPLRVFDTALDVVADVEAGHADVGAITAASPVPELETGTLKAIGISAAARLGGPYAGVPTWSEQGVDCVVGSWRGVSGPSGLGAAPCAFWEDALSAAVVTPQWQAALARLLWTPMYLDGAALRDHLARERSDMRAVLGELGLLQT